jgi:hypothetical protein
MAGKSVAILLKPITQEERRLLFVFPLRISTKALNAE